MRRRQKQQYKSFIAYQKRRRSLLYFLDKGIKTWDDLLFRHGALLRQKDYDRVQLIRTVYEQQQARFDDPEHKIKDRILSLSKAYIRPIINYNR